jgi:hypothetical protein
MTEFERVLIDLDGITPEHAKLELKTLQDFIKSSGDLEEIEEFLMDEYGLNPKYLVGVM